MFMRILGLKVSTSIVAVGAALAISSPSFAQDAAAADENDGSLDVIVVTASPGNKAQIDSSVAVTSVGADLIDDFKPSSEGEVFRLLPGIQVPGTSGPGGNSNIAVRGLPVATGGSPFVQLQEDGLPTVLFGDIQFGNNDYWTRFDASVERLESVRGGGATTFASQAPGAVINYISNTGKKEGGYVQLSKGLGYDETKVDFRYGGPISETLRFHIGGFFKTGRGPLHADFNVSNSIQIKANVTKEFDEGKGYFRLSAKFADTQEPNYTGAPALATLNGNKLSNIKAFPGFDGRDQSNYSNLNRTMTILNREGDLQRVKLDGITTKQTTFGGEFHYEFNDTFTVDNKFRWSDISGGFASPFLNVATRASVIGSTLSLNGTPYATVASVRYASGPNAGQVFTGQYVDNNVNVRTNIRDLGSVANDLGVTGKFDVGFGDLTARAGYFYMNQDIGMDWFVNRSLRELSGNNASQLDLYDAAGNKLTQDGISGYGNNWGNCCARNYDLSYTNTAPNFLLDLDTDRFAVDASVRFERVKASGGGTIGGAEFLVNSNGVNIPAITSNGTPREVLNYTRTYTSWTAGALFKATDDFSIFARASRGGRFNSDRQTFGGKFSNAGALCTGAQAAAGTAGCTADGVTPSVDFVRQYEVGVKARGDLLGGGFTAELSLLKGNFKQSTYELSATRCGGAAGGCVIDARYKSSGAEFYGTYRNGGMSLVANATYSKAKRSGVDGTGNPTPFSRAPNLPDLSYTVAANYDIGDIAMVGVNVSGQTSTTDDPGRIYPGAAIFGGVVRITPFENLEFGIQAYNLFNTYDIRGNGNNVASVTGTQALVTGTPTIGRTFTGSIKYKF
jgi:outer membrane receptor protein involved in Fe transport